MITPMRTARGAALGLTLACAACASAPAAQPATPAAAGATPATPAVRSPDAILADAIAATGGAAAWNGHRTVHIKVSLALPAMAMGGPGEHFGTRNSKSLTVSELPGFGQIRDGTNGTAFWAQEPVNGLRILQGPEEDQARIEDAWNVEMQARELFAKIETATDAPPGQECLTLTPRVAPVRRTCYDRQTHLEVSQEGTQVTPQGNVPFRTTASDWRTVGNVKIPYSSQMQTGPMTIVTTVTEVAFDEPMDEKMFDPPAVPSGK